ncbi:hypothetical protein HU200_003408 [Digitaria exilis]|uniref:NB-ARC domain-containing protein n=1 Tax=Digitaria exilis TaxID=1010633 RepID=A0A835KUG9_9POAL|nr:hypothetical protein HU200_003408 [Digitaria exilis]
MCRFFVIVDDIWSTQAWELVKSTLPENTLNSRIITTTRITNVATSSCDQQSQQLFFKRVFGDTSACPPHLEEISHGILKKCHGLPLAIITIASLLAGKPIKDQWEQVYNSISSAFSHQGMRDILLLSYYDLPHHLKTCLLYLSMFPEDTRIGRDDLIWRWIAEGFIAEARGQTADQVALSYFNELINRSLIQPVEILFDGQVEECREHDMVLELIVSLSAEENFASIVEGKSYNAGGHKIRRLSIQSKHVGDEVMQEIVGKLSQARSISFYELKQHGIPHIRDLNGLGNEHVKFIGSLFQLTFLSISRITKLPSSTSRLQKLVRLLVSTHVEFPDQIGDLQALQELSRINHFSINFVEDLRRLTKLKRLGMDLPDNREKLGGDMGRYEEALKSSLSEMGKHGLQSLDICATGFLEEELIDIVCCTLPCLQKLALCRFHLSNLPKQMVSLVNLTHLSIWVGRIKQEDLCIIGDMPALLFAELHVKHSPDERLTISGQRFLCLKEFKFSNDFFSSGGGLEMLFLQEAMPELRRLHLQFRAQEAESKMGFEFSFEHLASLEHITVTVHSGGAAMSRVEAAKAAVREAARIHPGNPTLDLHVDWY